MNSAWTTLKGEAGKASITTWPWSRRRSSFYGRNKPACGAAHKKSLPAPTLPQVRRLLQTALIRLEPVMNLR